MGLLVGGGASGIFEPETSCHGSACEDDYSQKYDFALHSAKGFQDMVEQQISTELYPFGRLL